MKVGIITLDGYENFGNRLQNYALQEVIESMGFKVYTLWTINFKQLVKYFLKISIPFKPKYMKNRALYLFSKKYIKTRYIVENVSNIKKYDYFICGSDQVWNYNFKAFGKKMFLSFSPKEKNIAYAASFGVNKVDKKYIEIYKDGLNNFKTISVREDTGKSIIGGIDKTLSAEVVLDPTMLLERCVWEKLIEKSKINLSQKYILVYLLGKDNNLAYKTINKFAKEKGLVIVDIMNQNSNYYSVDPVDFLYLEKNAELICTDSFHASVFGLIFDKPFVVFDRVDGDNNNMYSRIDTLLSKFKINNRKFDGKSITRANIDHDYSDAYKVLKIEREKSIEFLRRSLEL